MSQQNFRRSYRRRRAVRARFASGPPTRANSSQGGLRHFSAVGAAGPERAAHDRTAPDRAAYRIRTALACSSNSCFLFPRLEPRSCCCSRPQDTTSPMHKLIRSRSSALRSAAAQFFTAERRPRQPRPTARLSTPRRWTRSCACTRLPRSAVPR